MLYWDKPNWATWWKQGFRHDWTTTSLNTSWVSSDVLLIRGTNIPTLADLHKMLVEECDAIPQQCEQQEDEVPGSSDLPNNTQQEVAGSTSIHNPWLDFIPNSLLLSHIFHFSPASLFDKRKILFIQHTIIITYRDFYFEKVILRGEQFETRCFCPEYSENECCLWD